jgi:hypothetical protein
MIGPLLFTQVFAVATAARMRHPVPGAPYALAAMLLATSLAVAYFVTQGSEGPATGAVGPTAPPTMVDGAETS